MKKEAAVNPHLMVCWRGLGDEWRRRRIFLTSTGLLKRPRRREEELKAIPDIHFHRSVDEKRRRRRRIFLTFTSTG